MSLSITALVIGGSSEHLEETLFGLKGQSKNADRVIIGCVDEAEVEIAKKHNFPHIDISGTFAEKVQALVAAVEKTDWYWILFSDSCPEPQALEKLALTAETSPSASVVAPKLVEWEHPSKLISFGKTITQAGEGFELVDAEIDQGQHDLMRDVLAADFAGALYKHEALIEFDLDSSPMASQSTLFGIRQWLSGYRVLLEPAAKVRLTFKHGIDGEKNLFGNYFAKRFADYHLSLITLPRVLAFLVWIVIPVTAVFRSLWLVGSRKVTYFFPELFAGAAAFVSVPSHLRVSAQIRSLGKPSSIRQLRAERARTRDRARRRFSELPPTEYRPGLLSGPWAWLMPALLVLNYRLFPSAEAATGGNLLPLNANWFEMATNGWREIGSYPSDPLVFPISVITVFSAWAPSSGLGVFIFLAPVIAFAGAWLALARLTDNRLLITAASFAFSATPVYALQIREPDISAIIVFAFMGMFIHALVMIIQSTVSSRAWRWTAWATLLMAMISAATPYLLPILIIGVFVLAITKLNRMGFLIFVPILSLILLWPNLVHWIINPLTIFAPMGGDYGFSSDWQPALLILAPLSLLFLAAVISMSISPKPLGLVLIFAAVLSVIGFAFIENLQFIRTPGFSEISYANGVPILLMGVLSLLLVLAMGKGRFNSVLATSISIVVGLTGGYLQLTVDNGHSWGEYRQVPAIVEVESQRFELNTLMISESGETVSLREGNGENLGEQSVLGDLLGQRDSVNEELIASLAASLIASNSVGISETMNELSIAFVQLEGSNPAISSQLSRLPQLSFAGQTAEGALWRVDQTELKEKTISVSLLQLLPWLAIILTVAASIPTAASIRGRARIRGSR